MSRTGFDRTAAHSWQELLEIGGLALVWIVLILVGHTLL